MCLVDRNVVGVCGVVRLRGEVRVKVSGVVRIRAPNLGV